MDSQSAPVVSAAKLPILNPTKFDLWKMRIEQYFLMTDYSLWGVIINGDSVISRVAIDGVAQPVTVLTADQKLARKNELKARGSLLMALPDKHQLKFNSHKDAKTLIEAIEKRFRGNTETKKKLVSQLEIHRVSLSQEDVNLKFLHSLPSEWKTHTLIWKNKANIEEHSLDDLFNSLKIYETKVSHSSSLNNPTQNLAFVSSSNIDSTTDSVSAATSVSAVCAKLLVSSHPNIDSLSNAIIFSFFSSQSTNPQLYNEDLKQIDVDDIKEIDLRWQMAMLTMRARRFLQKTRRNLGDNRVTTMGFHMSKVECYNCHRKGHFARECRYTKDTRRTGGAEPYRRTTLVENSTSNALVFQCDGIRSYDWSYQAEEEPANFALMAIPSSSSSDNEVSPAKPAQAMSHTTESMPPIIEDWVSNSEDESKPNYLHSASVQPIEVPILAATPKPTIKTSCCGKRNNRKTYFVYRSVNHLIKDCNFHVKPQTKPTPSNSTHRGCNKQYASFTKKYPQKHKVSAAVLPKSKLVSITAVRQVSAAVSKIMKSRPRPAHTLNKKSNPSIRTYKTNNQFSKTNNSSSKVTATMVSVVSAVKGKKGKWVWRPKCPILDHDSKTTGNMSYLSDFQELNGGYVAFGGNPKGGKISGKGKIKTDFKLPDENQVLLRVPRENNMYNVNLKNIVPSGDLTCLFAKETIDKSNLWHRRQGHINFKTINKLAKFEGKVDEGFLVGYSVNSKVFRVFNNRTHIIQETLDVNFLENKPNVAGNQTNPSAGFQDTFDADKAEKEDNLQYHDAEKPESSVNLSPSRSVLSGEKYDMTKKKDKGKRLVECFSEYIDLNAVFKDFSEDSSNDVSAASPIVSTVGKNYSNNTNPISAIGPIVNAVGHNYSNNTNPISVAGPSNSNSSPTHGQSLPRDTYQHPDTVEMVDIVGAEADFTNLELLSQLPYLHVCMFLSQEEPKRVYQALKDPSWIKAMHEELLQFKMQKVGILVDFPHGKRTIGTKWVYRNKKDEKGIVVRNKVRLIAQGHTQEEGIDYEEVFAPVARIEAIRLFLAYASFTGFMVYQMDVKSTFLYGTIEEEMYVCQPLGFEDPDHHDKVYKVVKALYGLHQAPRAWYETLAIYLLENGFHRGQIDQTLFIKKQKGDILLVQIYVDDIIFGATNKDLCKSFEKLMKDKFQMSSIGELTFFLGLQVKQKEDEIFINQDKYVVEILKKFGLTEGKSIHDLFFNVLNFIKTRHHVCKAEYVAGASCCTQVLWIQNQMLDSGQKLDTTEKERDDLNLKLEKFQTSSKGFTDLLASQTLEKAGFVPSGGYHVVSPPVSGTFMPPKPDLVFHTPPSDENEHLAINVQLSPTKPEQDLSSRPSSPIIEDWVSDSEEDDMPPVSKDVPSFA
nr:putative ribonuclease H-like domain-containing protein [Tanacetum cinerariifolium]